jgi:DNA-binding transcriptional ArsR family regulator
LTLISLRLFLVPTLPALLEQPGQVNDAEDAEEATASVLRPFRLRALHRALADPLGIRLFEHLVVHPRSAKELAEAVGMPPDRLYHQLARLEEAGLITIADYRPLPGGKVERVYAAAEAKPPGDEASPADTARFFSAVIEATRADVTSALMASERGQRRDISLTRPGLRLSDADRTELLAGVPGGCSRSS